MIALLLIILLVVLTGSLFLMLWFGYRSAEEELAARKNAAEQLQALDGPRFFATLGPDTTADPAAIAPALIIQSLEDHVRREQQVVAGFLNGPTVERLFPDEIGVADALTKNLEYRIRHDITATNAFFDEPSVDRLFRDLGYAAA